MIRVWSCKYRSLLMWNSCRGGLTSCVLTHKTHTLETTAARQPSMWCFSSCSSNETPYQTSPASPYLDENTLHVASAAHCVTNLNKNASIFTPPSSHVHVLTIFHSRKILHPSRLWLSWLEGSKVIFSRCQPQITGYRTAFMSNTASHHIQIQHHFEC